MSEGNTIRYAAHKLSIKPSTAQQIMKKYKETGKVFCKIMNKSKTANNSTNSSLSEHLSVSSEVEGQHRPVEQPQVTDMAEQMRLLNESFLMQQAYLQWMNESIVPDDGVLSSLLPMTERQHF